MHKFIKDIMDDKKAIPDLYNQSPLIQYLDSKMGAINGDSKTRRSLGNI